MTPTSIVAYLVLFAVVGFLFVFVALLAGRFLRARAPSPEKLRAYECGEPPVGPGDVQFDLRFYVVALVFIVFEVEVAFFFPWATVFGCATQLSAGEPVTCDEMGIGQLQPTGEGDEMRDHITLVRHDARCLAAVSMIDMAIFFAVLMVAFFYVWYRGDLDWVRAIGRRE